MQQWFGFKKFYNRNYSHEYSLGIVCWHSRLDAMEAVSTETTAIWTGDFTKQAFIAVAYI
jgi:hypothetical protein